MRAASVVVLIAASCSTTTVQPKTARSIASPRQRPIASPQQRPIATPETEPAQETGALAGLTIEHNKLRAAVGVPALAWKNALGAYAQAWANHIAANNCQLAHRSSDDYGENLYWASGGAKTPAQVVALWGTEKASYDHGSNRCAPGQTCGHYTQMIWGSTRFVGCGRATCGGGEVWVCNYDPPGNFTGQSPY